MSSKKAVIVVLDSVGCGALPDAASYGDAGANTIAHVAAAHHGLTMPNLQAMGLGNTTDIDGVAPRTHTTASYGRMAERSQGKDTTTGHWEIAGLISKSPFPTYPDGFPTEVMDGFTRVTGLDWLGNKPASGTEILDELAAEHVSTGKPIVYTSADSVFQIAAHEDVIPPERLYAICKEVREQVCVGDHAVGRIIARPFEGEPGNWRRTHRRRDFALAPTGTTVPALLDEQGIPTRGIGKIGEIFAWDHITSSPHVQNNMDAWDKLLDAVKTNETAFVFANLVDFDMLWGHRSDAQGYAQGLEAVDARIPELLEALAEGDLLIITADHGCDPTDESTDHTREYVPLLALVKGGTQSDSDTSRSTDSGVDLGTRSTFADAGATILDFFDVDNPTVGTSFLPQLENRV